MARMKEDYTVLSLTQLSEFTGKAVATINKRLKEAGLAPARVTADTRFYVPRFALPVIYGGVAYDPMRERARLDTVRREMVELQLAERRGQLLPLADVEALGAAVMSATAQRVLALRNTAPEIRAAGSDVEGVEILEEACREALSEVARLGAIPEELRGSRRGRAADVDESAEAAAEADGERVGGSGTEA